MTKLPGGKLTSRPLHFIWICDCSGSMSLDGKMTALNTAVREALPAMRQVAEENPNAAVMLHTLRFSSGASWVNPEPLKLEQFQWIDLVADDLPRTAQFAAEFRSRLQREGAKSGDVQISLIWNNYNDLDLHVICPSGEEIYFGHRKSRCGGELDVDMNVSPTSTEPVENVYWPKDGAPQGHYKVLVHHFRNHGRAGCKDPTPYRVAVSVGGIVQEFSGRISHGNKPQLVHEFDSDAVLTGSGGNTDMGAALTMVADQLKIPPMSERALPPVLVLISDGQPTDDFVVGLQTLMNQAWAKKAVRLAIAMGNDADLLPLQQFIGHAELQPLQANNPTALVQYIKWVSTAVLQMASAPPSQVQRSQSSQLNVPMPTVPNVSSPTSATDVW